MDKLKKIKGNLEEQALKDMEKLQKIMIKDEAKERLLRELKEQTALEMKEKNKKF